MAPTSVSRCEDAIARVAMRAALAAPATIYHVVPSSFGEGAGAAAVELPQHADPFLRVLERTTAGPAVVLCNEGALKTAAPHMYHLARLPVAVHVALTQSTPDYGLVAELRETGCIILLSSSLREAQDMALVAQSVSSRLGRGVLHFCAAHTAAADEQASIPVESDALVAQLLSGAEPISRPASAGLYHHALAAPAASPRSAEVDGDAPATNGHSYENHTNGHANGHTNGHVASGLNGHTNGESASATPTPAQAATHAIEQAFDIIKAQTGREYLFFSRVGKATSEGALLLFGSYGPLVANESGAIPDLNNVCIIQPRVLRPWSAEALQYVLPSNVKRIAILEQIRNSATRWGPIFLDVLASQAVPSGVNVVDCFLGTITKATVGQALRGIVQNMTSEEPIQSLVFGNEFALAESSSLVPHTPSMESTYYKILTDVFDDLLYIANKDGSNVDNTFLNTTPEFALGKLLAMSDERKQLYDEMSVLLKENKLPEGVASAFKELLSGKASSADKARLAELATKTANALASAAESDEELSTLAKKSALLKPKSEWIVTSDAWAHDLGNAGLQALLSQELPYKLLVIDSTPYSSRGVHASERKKDIGLYAMNWNNAYVASTAVYSSYSQVITALIEADKFDGPAVVLAYLPHTSESDSPITVLQETKKAVDVGYWPLYRYDPRKDPDNGGFQLDSERVREELKKFLERENYLTMVARKSPAFAASLDSSYGSESRRLKKESARDALNKLLESLSGAPITILYGSDGGNAASLAKRLGRRAQARSLKPKVLAMDDYVFEDISGEQNLVLITCTAGQGEPPQNAKEFFEHVKGATDLDLSGVKVAVFGLGDSKYWPRKEDKIYYNKPGKDLENRIKALGAQTLVELGLGDDQDPDGFETGYLEWEPQLWKALGVDDIVADVDEPKPLTNEDIKIQSDYLRGTIIEGLADESTGRISESDLQLTKFHGTYMQDDRDIREERKLQGLEPAYSFMIRVRLSAGVCTPDQWLKMDKISDDYGNGTFKLTTRQTFQFHGVLKYKLRASMQAINKAMLTTLGACGDVNRNVMLSSVPASDAIHSAVYEYSKKISDHLLPMTHAYHEIWLMDDDGKKHQVAGEAVQDHEPLYGPTYLPRKFKISIAIPPMNDIDVYAHDIGLIAIEEDGKLAGFNMTVGGGMGATRNNKKTYPNVGQFIGFVTPEQVVAACEKVMLVQRDHGDRTNRKHARLKYTIDTFGLEWFKGEVEKLLGWSFAPIREFKFTDSMDRFGWFTTNGPKGEKLNHFGMFIENGRVEGRDREGLREIARILKGEFRLTGNQHLYLSKVPDSQVEDIKKLMRKYNLDNIEYSGLRMSSSACVALPTCGLAMAESERYLPRLVSKVEELMYENGLGKDHIVMRMTGCPNGCARPYVAEIAFVGKSEGMYDMFLGGGHHGERLNKLYRASVDEGRILDILRPLLKRYALEREEGEKFGDFVIRIGVIKATRRGLDFHDDVPDLEDDE